MIPAEALDGGLVVDLFRGAGGWDEGVRALGLRPVGYEWDANAHATAIAAGHLGSCVNVLDLDPRCFRPLRGLIASPPCPKFSEAANLHGADSSAHLIEALRRVVDADDLALVRSELHDEHGSDDASLLSIEPLRWALDTRPEWIAWEQVRGVLPVWEACAVVLRRHGYSVATGVLHAEQYGVPQVRRRAVLVARSLELTDRLGPAKLPEPTHSRYHNRTPGRLDLGVKPWRTMYEAVGWGYLDRPAPTLVSQSGGGRRLLDGGSRTWASVLEAINAGRFVRAPHRIDRPVNRGDLSTCSIVDGSLLQTFPADYPWQGVETYQAKQIGNAVPPMLARAIVSEVAGIPDPLR